jgi:hypothetical protein
VTRTRIQISTCSSTTTYGEDLVEWWRREAAYTEPLQRATIQKHWRFFPWWYFEEKLRARDATVWRYDVLVQSAYNIVGVLAALNRVYFSKVEFKRADKFLARLEVAPPNLAARLNALFDLDERASTDELEPRRRDSGARRRTLPQHRSLAGVGRNADLSRESGKALGVTSSREGIPRFYLFLAGLRCLICAEPAAGATMLSCPSSQRTRKRAG